MNKIALFQIGKAGITDNVIGTLARMLENHKFIRISCLAASGRTKTTMPLFANELVTKLAPFHHCSTAIIGFTIILRNHPGRKNDARAMKG